MTLEEREAKSRSQLNEPTNIAKTKANLIKDLQKAGVSMTALNGKRVWDLQDLATLNNVADINHLRK